MTRGGSKTPLRLAPESHGEGIEEKQIVMNIPAPCAVCFLEGRKDNPSANPPIVFYKGRVKDEGYVRVKCTKGHDTIILYDERKYDLLFISACHAMISGYEREAVSSFAASLERVYEFFIFVASRHCKVSPEVIERTWKLMAKQSERQLGAFLAFYEFLTNEVYPLDNKMAEFRNKVIHQGYILDEKETEIFGDYIFNQKLALIKILQDKCSAAFDDEIKAEMDKMKNGAPKDVPQLGFKATLVNVDLATHMAIEITKFSDYIFGIKENLKNKDMDNGKMPTDLIHLIGIRAPAVTIYEAITTERGVKNPYFK